MGKHKCPRQLEPETGHVVSWRREMCEKVAGPRVINLGVDVMAEIKQRALFGKEREKCNGRCN